MDKQLDGEPEAYVDDTLRSIGISPRERLAHIESALEKIDQKLDVRFDTVEKRLTAVENAQAGQTSTAVLVSKAQVLAEETAKEATKLADERTKTAADLAKDASAKATVLAEDQKKLDTATDALKIRMDAFDRKLSWYSGAAAVAVFAAGLVGYFIR